MAKECAGGLVVFALVLHQFCFFSRSIIYDIIILIKSRRVCLFFCVYAPIFAPSFSWAHTIRTYKVRRGATPHGAPACPNGLLGGQTDSRRAISFMVVNDNG